MFQIALAVSGIVGGFMAGWSFAVVMWVSVISQIICFFLSIQLTEPKVISPNKGNIFAHLKEAIFGFITNRKLRLLSISSIISLGNIISKIINIIAVGIPTILSPFLMTLASLKYGITTVAENSLLQKEFTNHQRATMGSLNSFAGSIFFGIVAFILGKMADIFTPAQGLLALQIIAIPTLWLYWN